MKDTGERFYIVVGLMGLVALLLAWLVRRADGGAMALLYLAGALVIVLWAARGIMALRDEEQRRREVEERAAAELAARQAAERKALEEEQALQRAMRDVMARRTTSHGGMTINVHRTKASGQSGQTSSREADERS